MLPIFLALVFIALLIFIVIAGQPSDFRVTRSVAIAAPPEHIFPHVNELRNWEAWSPWAKLDPNAKSTFSGAAAGVGAAMAWDGNKKIGAGKMTVTTSQPNELVRIRLEFIRPFQATNVAEFNFKSNSRQTEVTWTMTGRNNFFFKIFGLFMNCDNMVGKDFEKGLAGMKSLVETTADKTAVPA